MQSKKSRQELIAQHRQSQSLELLKKRADMAKTKSKLWTQEELDVSIVEGQRLFEEMTRINQESQPTRHS